MATAQQLSPQTQSSPVHDFIEKPVSVPIKCGIYALRKCTRLNERQRGAQLDPPKVTRSGFRDVDSYRAYSEGARDEAN